MRNTFHEKASLIALLATILLLLNGCGTDQKSSEFSQVGVSSSVSKRTEVFISECGYGYSHKPSSLTLTCADGGMYIDKITYSTWSSTAAQGNGIFYENTCDPECASGKFIHTNVSISISEPMEDTHGKMIFSKLIMNAETELYNGTKTATFDISNEPESADEIAASENNTSDSLNPNQYINDLLDRLNLNSDLWQYNFNATSEDGQYSQQRLGLFSPPDYVIECNLSNSGTWLFVYSDENSAYDAFNSDYFFRNSHYSAALTFDPTTNLIVILHTSMGGNKTCLNSAFEQLEYYATD